MKPVMLGGDSPEALMERFGVRPGLERAAEIFAKLGIPDKKSEQYRYFDIESLMQKEWEVAAKGSVEKIDRSSSLVITDGIVTSMPEGVEIDIGCSNAADVSVNHFDPIYYLGHLMSESTILVRIKKDMELKIVHRYTQAGKMLAYRIALYVDANVHASLFEVFDGKDAAGALVVSGYDLFLAGDASLLFVKSQTLSADTYIPLSSHRMKVDRNASLDMYSFDYGSGSGLQLMQVELHEHATAGLSHLLYISDSARRGTVSRIIHEGIHSRSDQRAKNILQDSARGIFDALIKVEYNGKYTKAHQNSKAILLNKGAHMASKPQLEIYIDDLEASHGSTTGRLDEQQLFYLRSRGISASEAKKMLIQAFANEMIDAIGNESVKETLHADFERAYYGKTHLECMETCHGCEEAILGSKVR